MENYYIKSIIYDIGQEIKRLIAKGIITEDKKIVLCGLDVFSFAMKTILTNHGIRVDSYISDEEELLVTYKRRVKAACARYINPSEDLIRICAIEERLYPFEKEMIVLNSSQSCPVEKIEGLGYQKGKYFFQLYDWQEDSFARAMQGKQRMVLHEVQSLEKKMLEELDRFCLGQGLRYWVCGGTLLGTMRHKGFIPWDDDIDVFMPWEDYQRFLREFRPGRDYSLIVPSEINRKNYYMLFSKLADNRTIIRECASFVQSVHPVTLDIFPLIGLPEEAKERKAFFRKYDELEKTIWEDFYANNGDLSVYNKWYSEQEDFLTRYRFDESDYVGVLATAYKDKDCTTRGVYRETLRLPFEDIEVNVPVGYQEYLDNLYGKDWMQLPDENRRKSHHNMEAYWL